MHFLMELVKDYLQEAHPEEELPELFLDENITGRDMEEDSFSQYYSSDAPRKRESKKPAFQLKGEKLRQEDMSITEVCIPVREIHARAKAAGVSITVFLTAALIWAIHEEVPQNQAKKPIGLMIPVNLRNYFPSQSMANFFGWIEISCYFSAETTFEDILESVKEQFAKELSKDVIEAKLNDLVSLEKNPILRLVPLEIKTPFLLAGTTLGGRSITAIYSNVGIIRMPEEYRKYIQRFGLFASTDSLQLCSCSFGDEMVLSFSSKIPNGNIERNFVEKLKKEQVSCEIRENDFPGQKEERKAPAKLFESFTFLCIVLAVVCNLIDYLVDGHMGWAWFVTAGAFCTWLMVSVAYVKRRNLLKNDRNGGRCAVGCVYRLAGLVRGLSASFGSSCGDLLYVGDHSGTEAGSCRIYDLSSGSGSFRCGDPIDPSGHRCGECSVSVSDLCLRQFPDACLAVSV